MSRELEIAIEMDQYENMEYTDEPKYYIDWIIDTIEENVY